MKKQTAVEWLTDQLRIDGGTMRDKALAMEKEQIEDAFLESRLIHPMIGFKHEAFNDYFNETYGGDK
jgi:hypothetical protein